MKKPNKPTKPIEPKTEIQVQCGESTCKYSLSVKDLLEMIPEGLDLGQVIVLSADGHDYDERPYISLSWSETQPNPRYTSEMKKYEKALAKYELDKVRYEDNLKAYNAEQKALKVQLDQETELKLRKQYEDLKKKFEPPLNIIYHDR
jgi:hypothetical protein